ncbi:hypothetical protein JYT97_00870 [Haliea sp. AH-315-K21]|nr:hypothetical protein [Haliea sp. AH-315-K21]
MIIRKFKILTALISVLLPTLLPTLVLSQDFSLSPINGSISLSGGFSPDPNVIAVTAGGNFQASNAGSECSGYITDAPTYSLTFDPGSLGLGIYINADFDTTIVINGPSGDWYCDDDYPVLGLDAGWYFDDPDSGRYDIWVGAYSESDVSRTAMLAISEYSDDSWETDLSPTTSASVFVPEVSLSGGFTPDPYTIDVVAGGENPASNLDSSCSGYVTPNPTYRLNFSPGSLGLGIYTLADIDTTIAIQSPNGTWYCNDDNSNLEYSLNSGYYFASPASGEYDIYVGAFSESSVGQSATLAITEYSESSWNSNDESVTPDIPDGEIQFGRKLF